MNKANLKIASLSYMNKVISTYINKMTIAINYY